MHCDPCCCCVCVCVVARYASAARERLETYHPANTLNVSIFNSCGDVRIDFLDPVPRAPCIPSPNAKTALLIFKGVNREFSKDLKRLGGVHHQMIIVGKNDESVRVDMTGIA